MKVLINYSNLKFRKAQKINSASALNKGGFDKVIEYTPENIDKTFYKNNYKIFNYKRGNGLWLWKPYFIYKTLLILNDNDILFYSDSGSYFIRKIDYLLNNVDLGKQSVIGFELPLLERQFTKKETFKYLNINNYDNNQILATYILFKKDQFSLNFVKEWLELCCHEHILSPEKHSIQFNEFSDFVSHREDQSIFSLLYHKYKLEAYRDLSQFGDRPFEYQWVKKFAINNKEWSYIPKEYTNSNYPRILNLTRGVNYHKFHLKEIIKSILNYLNLYTEKVFNKLHSVK